MSHVIALPPVLTAQAIASVQAQLRPLLQQPVATALVLDAAQVQSFDSAGLALLLDCRRQARAQGHSVQVQGWTSSLLALAQVYGVLTLLDPEAEQPAA